MPPKGHCHFHRWASKCPHGKSHSPEEANTQITYFTISLRNMQFGYCIICPCFLIGLGLVCKLDQIRVLARHHCISIRTGFHMKRTLYPARNKGEGITRGLEDITFLYHCCPSRTCHWLFNCEIYSALMSIIYPDRFIR